MLPLGRPLIRSPRDQRNAVIHFLDEFGPQVGLPTLRECFPEMCRAELENLLTRYRCVWRERNREPLRVLHWPVAGRVWAIDYAEPPSPIEGRWNYLLAARDLASGMQLLWLPVEAATGANAASALDTLFAVHGAPLVLKSDNGGHFCCPAVQDLLRDHQVESLLSPPHWPRYNGAIEAGIGGLKTRTNARAARAGTGPSTTRQGRFAKPMHCRDRAARTTRARMLSGRCDRRPCRPSGLPSEDVSIAIWKRKNARVVLASAKQAMYGQSARWLAMPSDSHSRSAGIFTTRGGSFPHRFQDEMWQAFLRRHIIDQRRTSVMDVTSIGS